MDSLLDFVLVVIAAVFAGLLVPYLQGLLRGLPPLWHRVWIGCSRPFFLWLGWIVADAEMTTGNDGTWSSDTPWTELDRGTAVMFRTVAHSQPTRTSFPDGRLACWTVQMESNGSPRRAFEAASASNRRRFLRRLAGGDRVLVRGTLNRIEVPKTPLLARCELVAAWRHRDRRDWQRIAGWFDIAPAPSSRWGRIGRLVGRGFRRRRVDCDR